MNLRIESLLEVISLTDEAFVHAISEDDEVVRNRFAQASPSAECQVNWDYYRMNNSCTSKRASRSMQIRYGKTL